VSRLTLTVIGCSGSVPGPQSAASCYLVEADDFRLVMDLGSGALGPLQRHCAISDIDAVLLSHLHPDHCIDVLPLYVARTYGPEGRLPRLPVYGPAGAGGDLARAYPGGRDPEQEAFGGAFAFADLAPGRTSIGPLDVTVARMAHPVPTWGIRIEHGGRAVVYSADTGPCESLVELARGADLFLCEASYVDEDTNPPDLHLTGAEAGEHAARAGVRRLVLTHIPPWFDPTDALAAAGKTFDGPIELARPGSSYQV
jgi:ribonuclease BN (tRNA processing enzyme)